MNMQLDRPLLVIGAHPDDIELMAGGLIARMTAGKNEVYSMVISDGGRNGDVQVRYRELKRAARILNIKDVRTCGVEDGNVPHNLDTVSMVEDYIDEVDPAIIITHTDQDTHQDHKSVCHITLSAARFKPISILLGETPSSYFNENLIYFDITGVINTKIKALRAYNSQIKNGPVNINNVRTLAAYRGNRVRVKYAEAFTGWRMVI
jgi:LmbE family N-acetylglucosaminyl deacetylase